MKAGSGLFNQEPYNETIATCLYGRLLESEDFVPYTLLRQDRRVYSCCPNMLRDDEELVSAIDLIPRWQSPMRLEEVEGLARRYESLGIRDARRAIDKMLTCDLILANTDRHYRNFGLIRDCETLEYTRVAPLFDSGHSLWCTTQVLELPSDYEYVAKPFGFNGMPSREVLGLVSDLEWFETDRLDGFIKDVEHALAKNKLMPAGRIDQVCAGVERGIKSVKERAVELGRVEAHMSRVTRDMSAEHDDRDDAADDVPMRSGDKGKGAVCQPHGNAAGDMTHAGVERLKEVAETQRDLGSPSAKGIDKNLGEDR